LAIGTFLCYLNPVQGIAARRGDGNIKIGTGARCGENFPPTVAQIIAVCQIQGRLRGRNFAGARQNHNDPTSDRGSINHYRARF